ncbi:MAG TPA: hypothetical protein VGE59_04825 [Patescibacteria group bacterium]
MSLSEVPNVTAQQIMGGNIGIMNAIMHLTRLPKFKAAGEATTLKLLVLATSDDPATPLTGPDLWDRLKELFPLEGGGWDINQLVQAMEQCLDDETT